MLDAKDAALLYQLDIDCRQPLGQLAKKARVAKTVAAYRISRLEKQGIIREYYTLIDVSALGYSTYRVYLKFKNGTPEVEREIIEALVKTPFSSWVFEGEGTYQCGAVFLVKALEVKEFYEFWTGFLDKYRKFIFSQDFSIYIQLVQFPSSYLLAKAIQGDKERYKCTFGLSKTIPIDDASKRILRAIAHSARKPIGEIAKECRLSPPTVRSKLRELVRLKVIQGFKTNIDMPKLGMYHYKVDVQLQDYAQHDKLVKFIDAHPKIMYRDVTLKHADIEFELYVRSVDELHEIMDEIRSSFKGAIGTYVYYLFKKVYKINYFPV